MKRMVKKKNVMVVVILLLITFIIPIMGYASERIGKLDKILPDNLYLDGINLGGKSLNEVQRLIDSKADLLENKEIHIEFNEKSNKYTLEELGLHTNKNEIKEEITAILNNDLKLIEKYRNYRDIESNGRSYNLEHGIDYAVFLDALEVFDDFTLSKPMDAEYRYEEDQVKIIGGDFGYEMDRKRLYEEIVEKVNTEQDRFVLNLKEIEPEITIEDLQQQGIKEKISSFTTEFNSSNRPRSTNVRLAGSIIDGTILAPGEIFSFNEVVGKRTKERGFQEAGVYVNGKVDRGIGGGICQVSTTLYNAALLADLEIIERSNHSLTVPYVPLSRDAAVSWGTKDFKFRNNSDHYIYIHTQSTNDKITFDLFGTEDYRTVELISTTISQRVAPIEYVEDETLEVGQETIVDRGHDGYHSKLVKKVYENGSLIESKVLYSDRYLTAPKIVKKGIKEI